MSLVSRASFVKKVRAFCKTRLSAALPQREAIKFEHFLIAILHGKVEPPFTSSTIAWELVAEKSGVHPIHIGSCRDDLFYLVDALRRHLAAFPAKASKPRKHFKGQALLSTGRRTKAPKPGSLQTVAEPAPRRRGRKPRPIVEFPEPLFETEGEPSTFTEALELQMRRFGESFRTLHKACVCEGERLNEMTIAAWRRGRTVPRSVASLEVLERIERRYRLPSGYFRSKLGRPAAASIGHSLTGVKSSERRRLAWHLPDDFNERPISERAEILEWVREVVISGTTEFRRFQSAASKYSFSIRFPDYLLKASLSGDRSLAIDNNIRHVGVVASPPNLAHEMARLLKFKTSTLTALGFQRFGVWGEETARQKIEHFGLFFGALSASANGPIRGADVPLALLTFAMLVFPAVWDWYLQWRESRRRFYTAWEVDMLRNGLALTRVDTGWIRQNKDIADNLRPIPGLISEMEIDRARADWSVACDKFHKYASARAREIQRIVRVHRDPFEPILPILEAESPVGEYRKIADEILKFTPCEKRYPRSAAESVRSFLIIRLGLHLGLRQKNLRQLMFCPKGQAVRSERWLADHKRGELRWSDRDDGWEVLVPAVAFKNAESSFFGSKPFRLVLPDLGDLYAYLDSYISKHRAALLKGAADPGTLFVKTVKATSKNAEFDQNTFYETWRLIIQRYGIYNPYTKRGVIEGLLPHGPHNVRDVLATHILKKTGSYEQASYAIQDTPDMVAKHYGRFLPQDKAAMAARILNQVWEAA